jgi:hypothetical protein
MAGQGSFASLAASSIGYMVIGKLARNNHVLWKVHVLFALRGAQVAHLIDPETPLSDKTISQEVDYKTVQVPNPKYALWVIKDQQVLNFLLASLSREILAHITTNLMASSAWATIDAMFASQS